MKALHFLRWPLVLLIAGYLVFLAGSLLKNRQWLSSEGFVTAGYGMIVIAVVWIIIKFIFLKAPEDDTH
ncbi:MAG: hypothetical protein ACHQF0_12475 [Chitinophagales bacterium]